MLRTKFKLNEFLVIDCLMIGTLVGVVSGSWIATGVAALIVAGLQFISHKI